MSPQCLAVLLDSFLCQVLQGHRTHLPLLQERHPRVQTDVRRLTQENPGNLERTIDLNEGCRRMNDLVFFFFLLNMSLRMCKMISYIQRSMCLCILIILLCIPASASRVIEIFAVHMFPFVKSVHILKRISP